MNNQEPWEISRYFTKDEIKGITYENGKKVIHLKEGVRRNPSYETLFEKDMNQLNNELISYEKEKKILNYFFELDIDNELL